MSVTIRSAAPEESHVVYALMRAAFAESAEQPHPSSALRESLEDVERSVARGGAILALRDGRFIGSGRFEERPDRGWLSFERLAVLPAERGRGVGTRMVEWLEAHARARGLREVRVTARSREPDNRPYYRSLGYEVTGYSGRYGISNIRTHMRKRL